MAIEFRCPTCDKKLRTGDDKAGKTAKCPGCGTAVTVPSSDAAADDDFGGFPAFDDFEAAPAALPPRRSTGGAGGQIACPMCGAQNDPDTRHCYACGEDLQAAARTSGRSAGAPFDVGDQLSKGYELFKSEMGLCLGATVLYFLVPTVVNMVLGGIIGGLGAAIVGAGGDPMVMNLLQQTVQIPGFFVQVYFDAGYTLFMLNLMRGRTASVGDLFAGGQYFLSLALNRFIMFLAVFVCMIPAAIPFGIMLMTEPDAPEVFVIATLVLGLLGAVGSGVLMTIFWPYCWVIVDRQPGGILPLKASAHLTSGDRGQVILMGLLYWLLTLVGMLACCFGVLFTMPIANLMVGIGYDRLIRAKGLGT